MCFTKQNKRNIKTSQTIFGVVQCFRDKMPLPSLYHNYSKTRFYFITENVRRTQGMFL